MSRVFDFLASLTLAVILLALLLVGLAVGTIVETRMGVEAAGRMVYYSWWFLGLQGLFAVNVALSIVDLFPWGKKRIGYLMVHGSLLLIFVGAALTYFLKVEGRIALWEGEAGSVIEQTDGAGKLLSRHPLPFVVKLDAFVLTTYPGTMRPAGFESRVQISDPATGQTFPARIWMNHEFHYRGYALFQSSYEQDNGRRATILSVSKDPGQTTAFAGFILLVAGMLVVLGTRIGQARKGLGAFAPATGSALLAFLLVAGAAVLQAEPSESLRRLPVQHDGRVMPLDTLARDLVWQVTGSSHWEGRDPVDTLTGWMLDPDRSSALPVIRVESPAFAAAVGLPAGTTHVSFQQVMASPAGIRLVQEARQAQAEGRPRDPLHQAAEKLDQRMLVMQDVLQQEALRPLPANSEPAGRWAALRPLNLATLAQVSSGPRLPDWPTAEAIDREVLYNHLNPERLSWILLLGSLAASIAAWIRGRKLLDRAALLLLLGGFATMTWGLALRWQVGGRIPAANMYESMLFLAWGVGLFAVAAFAVLRNRLVVINASFMAALTMALVDLLPIDRFIHPIAPVLAGTPWLAIHVPIIMLGYAVLALGLVVAHMQIGAAIFAPRRIEIGERMYELLYWYMFVGSIFLIAGILTGSMWAASSWGRYWGWDPKEVWSLVAFLAYMAILHAKLDRLIGKFGVAVISILAFQTILMTYLGVNFVLTTGMHSYGMGDSPVAGWMLAVAVAEVAFLLWGWRAYRQNLATGN